MNNEQKPLYEYTATSFVTLTSDEFKAMQAELERLRGIEARLNAEIAERRAIEATRPGTYFQLYEMDVELLERIRDGSGGDE